MTTATVIVIAAVYALSAFSVWRWFHLAHSKNGFLHGDNIPYKTLWAVLLPVVNTICLCMWTESPYKMGYRNPRNANKFFRVKK
jgi:hypothetical protein